MDWISIDMAKHKDRKRATGSGSCSSFSATWPANNPAQSPGSGTNRTVFTAMMPGKFIPLLLLLLLVLPGCMVKNTMKRGAAFEAAGMFKDASEVYYKTCLKKPDKPEIKIALKRAGQLYIDEQAELMSQSAGRGDLKTTVYTYLTTRDFIDKVKAAGVELRPDPSMERMYNDAKSNYLSQRYEDGQRNITDRKYDEAKAVFEEISRIDPDFRDTRNYLKEATFEPKYQEGARLFGEGRFMDAYRNWKLIYDQDKNYKDIREQMNQALNERYKQGSVLLMNENFSDAAVALGEVFNADPDFRDVKQLYTEARNEPVYRNGNSLLTAGKCRTAYYAFDQVIRDAGVYRDAAAQRDKSLACAQYPVVVTTFTKKGYAAQTQQFQATLVGQLLNLKNIFLKVYDISSLDPELAKLSSSQLQPEPYILGRLSSRQDIKALLIVEFSAINRNEGSLIKENRTGFERTVYKNQAGETITNDTKVKYEEYRQSSNVGITLSWRLVRINGGQTLISDNISESRSDEIRYAVYNGNKDLLYPASVSNGNYSINTYDYRSLQNLLRAPKSITPLSTLTERAFSAAAQKISGSVNSFDPEK